MLPRSRDDAAHRGVRNCVKRRPDCRSRLALCTDHVLFCRYQHPVRLGPGADEIIEGVRRPMGLLDSSGSVGPHCACVASRLGRARSGRRAAAARPRRRRRDPRQVLARRAHRRAVGACSLLPLDRGYFKAEGLDVTIDEARPTRSSRSPASPPAATTWRFADINALIRYRDQNPAAPVKAVFMVYNRPPYAIVARKSRGITEPKEPGGQEARRAADRHHRPAMAAVRQAERHRRRRR